MRLTGKGAAASLPVTMLAAFTLAFGQLGDRRIVAVLAKSMAITLVVFAVFAGAGWLVLGWAFGAQPGLGDGALRAVVAALLAILAGWLLFRFVALAVLQLFADEVVRAVEARHYPAAAASAQPLRWREEARVSSRALLRSVGYNLAAAPVALLLLPTGIGPALLFAAVNAVLLGRELTEMVALRHRAGPGAAALPPAASRFVFGSAVVGLLSVPLLNLLAPVIGAAAATHLVHRRTAR